MSKKLPPATSEDWGCLVFLGGLFILFFFAMFSDFIIELIRVWRWG